MPARVLCHDIVFAVLVAVAIVVQLFIVPRLPLGYDTSQILYIARQAVDARVLPVHGILNSSRAYNPPFMPWLYLLPLWLTTDYAWAQALPGLVLHVGALACLYLLGRRHFTATVGLSACVLYAFSPRGLYFGHASWAQALLPALYVVAMYLSAKWLIERRGRIVAVLIPVVAVITGVHWFGALTLGVVALGMAMARTRVQWKAVALGVAVAGLLWLPYLRYELHRSFADILTLVQRAPSGPTPADLSPFCGSHGSRQPGIRAPLSDPPTATGQMWLHGSYMNDLLEQVARRTRDIPKALAGAVGANFHWSPNGTGSGASYEQALYVLTTVLSVTGLCSLVGGWLRSGTLSPQGQWLALVFGVPACLQALTPHNSTRRPDICWLFYGAQALLIAYALDELAGSLRPAGRVLWIGLVVVGCLALGASTREAASLSGSVQPAQRRMVAWIAKDALARGQYQVAVRYDYLREAPEYCWIVAHSVVEENAYLGAEHDYILETLYGVENVAKAPDGWVDDSDYVVVYPQGLVRYEAALENGRSAGFGEYAVLQGVQDAH